MTFYERPGMRFDPKSLGSFKRAGRLFAVSAASLVLVLYVAAQFPRQPLPEPTLPQAQAKYRRAQELASQADYHKPHLFHTERELQLAINRERAEQCEKE